MATPPTTRDAIKRLLRERGPMTTVQIAAALDMNARTVSSCISTSRKPQKHFYIVDYNPQRGTSGLPAARFAVGNRKDAPKPVVDRGATDRRYFQRHKSEIKLRRRLRNANPFLVAAGVVKAPSGKRGRVIRKLHGAREAA